METGYKCLRKKRIRQRTNTRTQGTRRSGRQPGSKNQSTIAKELLAKQAMLGNSDGLLAVEIMDQEIERLGELETVLYPWDAEGKQITGKSVNSYYWVSELRRDYLHMRAPYQTPGLSAVQMLPMQNGSKTTHVNVTILTERGEKEFSDVPEAEEMKLIEGSSGERQGGS
jgi:hypothetical protein